MPKEARPFLHEPHSRPMLFSQSSLLALSPLLVLAALSLISYFFGPEFTRFDRVAINEGQWWRILSCHITHLGFNHLMLNIAGLVLICLLFSGLLEFRESLMIVLLSALSTGLCLYFFEPQLQRYVGLSGQLHGIMLYAVIVSWRKQRLINSALLLIVLAKLVKEYFWGSSGATEAFIGGTVLIMSHVYGAISGIVFGLLQIAIQGITRHSLRAI